MRVKPSLALSIFLAGGAVLLSFWATSRIYRFAPVTSDENSYEFQARCFAEGRLRRPYPTLSDNLAHFMLIMDEDHGWLSRYPPGHALWLVPGVWMGEPRIMIFLAAGLAVFLLCMAARQVGMPVWTVGVPLMASPYFINLYGTALSHTSGFLYASALLAAWLAWKRSGRPLYAALAGLAWAMLFLNRTYTASLMALPLGMDALYLGGRRFKDRRIRTGILLFAGAAALGVVAYAVYNALAVGDPRTPTFLFYEPSEGLGFGWRHTQRLAVRHTERKGLQYLWNNIVSMDVWLWGFRGSLAAATALIGLGWKKDRTPTLLAATLTVWIGYVFFWFWGVQEVGGPVYFFETLPFVVFLAATGLHRLDQNFRRSRGMKRFAAPAAALLLAVPSALHLRREIPRLRKPQDQRRMIMDTVASAPPQSVIFMRNIVFPRAQEIVFNPRGMESERLLLHDAGDANAFIWKHVPTRTPYRLDGRYPDRLEALDFRRAPDTLVWSATEMHRRVGRNADDEIDGRLRIATESDGPGHMAFGRYIPLSPGRYRAFFDLSADDDSAGSVRIDVAARKGDVILAEDDVSLPSRVRKRATLTFEIDKPLYVEPRVFYSGHGTARAGRIGLEKL
jgi:hypothetical protein